VLRAILVPTSASFQRDCPQILDYLDGVLAESAEQGIRVQTESVNSRHFRSPETIVELGCQGVIQLGHPPPGDFPYHPLLLSELAYVVVGVEEGPAGYYVNEDVKLGTRMLVETLHGAGARRIGLLVNMLFANHRLIRAGYLEPAERGESGADPALVRDAQAATVVTEVKALLSQVDALIVAGTLGIPAVSYLRGTENELPLGLFLEQGQMRAFLDQAYFVHLDHHAAGREAVRLLAQVVAGTVTEPTCRRVHPHVTRPGNSA
jgi:DNA-binding LacI/PurR family transcriptional regulator